MLGYEWFEALLYCDTSELLDQAMEMLYDEFGYSWDESLEFILWCGIKASFMLKEVEYGSAL